MNTSYEREYHPYLKAFTIVGIVGGFLAAILPVGALLGDPSMFVRSGEELLNAVGQLLTPALIIWAGFRTLSVTDGFGKWDRGLSRMDKAIGMIAIVFGAMLGFVLLIFGLSDSSRSRRK